MMTAEINSMTLRDTLLAAMQTTARPCVAAVTVPVWGLVHVRALTVAEVEEQQAEPAEGGDRQHKIARGAARVLCDAEGNRLFDHRNPADVALLAAQPWVLLSAVVNKADHFNALSAAGVADAKNG